VVRVRQPERIKTQKLFLKKCSLLRSHAVTPRAWLADRQSSMSTHLHSDASFSNRPLLHARDGQHDTRKRAVRLCVVVVWWMAIAELVFRLAVWRGGQRQPSVVEKVVVEKVPVHDGKKCDRRNFPRCAATSNDGMPVVDGAGAAGPAAPAQAAHAARAPAPTHQSSRPARPRREDQGCIARVRSEDHMELSNAANLAPAGTGTLTLSTHFGQARSQWAHHMHGATCGQMIRTASLARMAPRLSGKPQAAAPELFVATLRDPWLRLLSGFAFERMASSFTKRFATFQTQICARDRSCKPFLPLGRQMLSTASTAEEFVAALRGSRASAARDLLAAAFIPRPFPFMVDDPVRKRWASSPKGSVVLNSSTFLVPQAFYLYDPFCCSGGRPSSGQRGRVAVLCTESLGADVATLFNVSNVHHANKREQKMTTRASSTAQQRTRAAAAEFIRGVYSEDTALHVRFCGKSDSLDALSLSRARSPDFIEGLRLGRRLKKRARARHTHHRT